MITLLKHGSNIFKQSSFQHLLSFEQELSSKTEKINVFLKMLIFGLQPYLI